MPYRDMYGRREEERKEQDERATGIERYPTRALPRFVAGLISRPQPVLLDLGPVVGANVTFFGENCGCKIFVEDLSKDIDRHYRDGQIAELPTFFERRFPQTPSSIDGILCWDILDYLEKPAALALVRTLTQVLRPGGLLLAFFGTSEPPADASPTYTRHSVEDASHLQQRQFPATRGKLRPVSTRDIQRLLEPLQIADQFLQKSGVREFLVMKPETQAASSIEVDDDSEALWLAAESTWKDCVVALLTINERLTRLDSRLKRGLANGVR